MMFKFLKKARLSHLARASLIYYVYFKCTDPDFCVDKRTAQIEGVRCVYEDDVVHVTAPARWVYANYPDADWKEIRRCKFDNECLKFLVSHQYMTPERPFPFLVNYFKSTTWRSLIAVHTKNGMCFYEQNETTPINVYSALEDQIILRDYNNYLFLNPRPAELGYTFEAYEYDKKKDPNSLLPPFKYVYNEPRETFYWDTLEDIETVKSRWSRSTVEKEAKALKKVLAANKIDWNTLYHYRLPAKRGESEYSLWFVYNGCILNNEYLVYNKGLGFSLATTDMQMFDVPRSAFMNELIDYKEESKEE